MDLEMSSQQEVPAVQSIQYPTVHPGTTVPPMTESNEDASTSHRGSHRGIFYKSGRALGNAFHSCKVTLKKKRIPEKVSRVGSKLGESYEQKTGRSSKTDGMIVAAGAGIVGGAVIILTALPVLIVAGVVGAGAVAVVAVAQHQGQGDKVKHVVGALQRAASSAAVSLGEVAQGAQDAVAEADVVEETQGSTEEEGDTTDTAVPEPGIIIEEQPPLFGTAAVEPTETTPLI